MAVSLVNGLTEHHFVPICAHGLHHPINIPHIPEEIHRNWHLIFGRRNPEECLQRLTEFMGWDDGESIEYSRDGLRTRLSLPRTSRPIYGRVADAWQSLFPSPCPVDVLERWLERWVPSGYFDWVALTYQGERYEYELDPAIALEDLHIPREELIDYCLAYIPAHVTRPKDRRWKRRHRMFPAERIRPWKFRVHLRVELANHQPLILY